MSSYLEKLEKEYKEGTGTHRKFSQGMMITPHDPDKVTVYLMSAPDTNVDENALYDLGAQIIKQSDNVTKAKVPIDNANRHCRYGKRGLIYEDTQQAYTGGC